MTVFTWLWITWGAVFLVIEGVALANKQPGDTLSEHVWKWFRVKGKRPAWTAARFGLLATAGDGAAAASGPRRLTH